MQHAIATIERTLTQILPNAKAGLKETHVVICTKNMALKTIQRRRL